MAKPLKTPAAGANAERKAIKAKVKRMIKDWGHVMALTYLLGWIDQRNERYNAKSGGLGKQKKATK